MMTPEASGRQGESRKSNSAVAGLRSHDTLAERYQLVRRAGEGGMGSIWVARDRVLDIDVAIKVIRGDTRTSEADARLLTEARAAARLGHPAIVRVLDFGRTAWGDPFMAMELLSGETLAALLDRERCIPPVCAVRILLPIIDALDSAHAKQIVHRDLKPDNIFLARDEASRLHPKVVDFGIAKLAGAEPKEALTHSGEVLGSPAYMSPEQARGSGDVDTRTDIWSLCVVLYELVAGRRPFRAANCNALLRAIIEEEPSDIADSAACDRGLWTIIAAGLRKNRDERWSSMRKLGEALALWLYMQGEREDICGSCIRTGWIEAGLSEVLVDTASSLRPSTSWIEPAEPRSAPPDSEPVRIRITPIEPIPRSLGAGATIDADAAPLRQDGQSLSTALGFASTQVAIHAPPRHVHKTQAADGRPPVLSKAPMSERTTGSRRQLSALLLTAAVSTILGSAGVVMASGLFGARSAPQADTRLTATAATGSEQGSPKPAPTVADARAGSPEERTAAPNATAGAAPRSDAGARTSPRFAVGSAQSLKNAPKKETKAHQADSSAPAAAPSANGDFDFGF